MQRQPSAKPEVPQASDTKASPQHTAMNLLARREHSLAELRRKLIAREYDPDVVEDVIVDLAARNLVSDERFAEGYVNYRMRRGNGPVRIRQELAKRGVDDSIASIYLVNVELSWNDCALDARIKKFGSTLPEDFKAKAKQMKFLEYRGFTTEQINSAFDKEATDD